MKDGDAAYGVHQLVLLHGHERAREMVPEKQRQLVDIAAEVMADERQHIGISYTGFCLTSLPHKRLADDAPWEKQGHRVTLLVEPGRLKTVKWRDTTVWRAVWCPSSHDPSIPTNTSCQIGKSTSCSWT